MKNPPIIIIGAGRSGTNILRDSICALEGFETWPCDEINYIWRHYNRDHNSDRFLADQATPKVKNYIQRQFQALEKKTNADYVVDKTCANSLKVPFIDAIFPSAKYIFLLRDGRDVASSAKQRWTAPFKFKYIWKKVQFVPISDISYYCLRYLMNRVKKLYHIEKRLAFWGPIYADMQKDLKNSSLIEVCGIQWRECVLTAYEDLKIIDPSRLHIMNYETFVKNPEAEMKKVIHFLNVKVSDNMIKNSIRKVSSKSINMYKKHLSEKELDELEPIVKQVMGKIHTPTD
jgi:hypothetical protein